METTRFFSVRPGAISTMRRRKPFPEERKKYTNSNTAAIDANTRGVPVAMLVSRLGSVLTTVGCLADWVRFSNFLVASSALRMGSRKLRNLCCIV